jgi:hypothetical protein
MALSTTATAPMVWLIYPDLWSLRDHDLALTEGWFIVPRLAPGLSRITRCWPSECAPGMRPFDSDLQAAEYMIAQAHQGSEFHARALRALTVAQIHGARGAKT